MESAEFQGKNETFSKEKIESAQPVKESTTHAVDSGSVGGRRIEDIRLELNHPEVATPSNSQNAPAEVKTYTVDVGGQIFPVEEVARSVLFPNLGTADIVSPNGVMSIREDLPDRIKEAVIAHEAGHLRKRTPSELSALTYGFMREPINSLRTVWYLLSDKEQREGIWHELTKNGIL